jgi:hypothetical protein
MKRLLKGKLSEIILKSKNEKNCWLVSVIIAIQWVERTNDYGS